MNDINTTVIIGRLTKDTELKYTTTNTAIVSMSLAVNRTKKQGDQWIDEASFFDVDFFGKAAESCAKRLKKGVKVAVVGFLKQDRWTDQQGNNKNKIKIIAETVNVLSDRSTQDGNGQQEGIVQQYDGGFKSDIPF